MDEQRSTYELAFYEVKHASQNVTSHAELLATVPKWRLG